MNFKLINSKGNKIIPVISVYDRTNKIDYNMLLDKATSTKFGSGMFKKGEMNPFNHASKVPLKKL